MNEIFKKWIVALAVIAMACSNCLATDKPVFVDLGLSVLWADRNYGADKDTDYGTPYGWGAPASTSFNNTYPTISDIRETEYDVCHSMDPNFRMPSYDELEELNTKCTWKYEYKDGVYGFTVTGPNNNSIFIPASGILERGNLNGRDENAYIWSGVNKHGAKYASCLHIHSKTYLSNPIFMSYTGKEGGMTIRAVASKSYLAFPIVVVIENVEYTLYENRTAHVNEQKGTLDKVVTIPAKVKYNNVEYTVTHVADYALKGHNEVEELRIECESPSIGKSVFSEMKQLKKLYYNIQRPLADDEYDYSATMFGYSPLVDCPQLKDVEFGPNVRMIMPYMFGTSLLDSIDIPDGVEGISHNCFGSSTLKKVTLGRDIQTIRFASFGNCQQLETVVYNCRNGFVPNEAWVNSYPPFGDRTPRLKNLYIGSEVETIPERLFSKVSTLEKIIVYATTPPVCATGCFNSTKTDKTILYVPFGTKKLYEQAPVWKNFFSIEEQPGENAITFPAVVIIDGLEYTLYENLKATLNVQTRQLRADIVIPESVKYADRTFVVDMIAENALKGHEEVETLTLNCEAPGIGRYAFHGMGNLKKIHYNIKKAHPTFNYVNTIWSKYLFLDCDNIEELTFGDDVVQVIPYFFSRCEGVKSFVIPSTVEELCSDCFTYMYDLKEVTIGEGLKSMGVAQFNGCSKLETVYYNCVDCKVADNYLTNSYPPFGKDNDALRNLYIGANVAKIHAKAFYQCDKLTDIYIAAITPPECNQTTNFYNGIKTTATLHVPAGCLEAYRSAPVWKEFLNIVESDSDEVYATGLTLSAEETTLIEGEEFKLEAVVSPDNASVKEVAWSSSDELVATVDGNGVVTAVAKGVAVITAATTDGSNLTASCTVTVLRPVSAVYMDISEITMEVGDTETVTAYASPTDASDTALRWYSEDETVATVADGIVKAIGEGSTYIVAQSVANPDVYAKCLVTVIDPSGIADVAAEAVKVFVEGKIIHVANVPAGETAYVIQPNGRMIMKQASTGEEIVCRPEVGGVFIVAVGAKAFKVEVGR